MRQRDPLRRAIDRDPGALAHAVRLLKWWAEDMSDDPQILEMVKQSREVARALTRFERAAKRPAA